MGRGIYTLMGYYTDLFNAGNTTGQHTFDAEVLDVLTWRGNGQHKDGELAEIMDNGRQVDNVVLHRNGRRGLRALAKDTVVIQIQRLKNFPDSIQAKLKEYEQTPDGRREGVNRPRRRRRQ